MPRKIQNQQTGEVFEFPDEATDVEIKDFFVRTQPDLYKDLPTEPTSPTGEPQQTKAQFIQEVAQGAGVAQQQRQGRAELKRGFDTVLPPFVKPVVSGLDAVGLLDPILSAVGGFGVEAAVAAPAASIDTINTAGEKFQKLGSGFQQGAALEREAAYSDEEILKRAGISPTDPFAKSFVAGYRKDIEKAKGEYQAPAEVHNELSQGLDYLRQQTMLPGDESKLTQAIPRAMGTTVGIIAASLTPGGQLTGPLAAYSLNYQDAFKQFREANPDEDPSESSRKALALAVPLGALDYASTLVTAGAARLDATLGRRISQRLAKSPVVQKVLNRATTNLGKAVVGTGVEIATEESQLTLQDLVIEGRLPTLNEYAFTAAVAGFSTAGAIGAGQTIEWAAGADTPQKRKDVALSRFGQAAYNENLPLFAQYISGSISPEVFTEELFKRGYVNDRVEGGFDLETPDDIGDQVEVEYVRRESFKGTDPELAEIFKGEKHGPLYTDLISRKIKLSDFYGKLYDSMLSGSYEGVLNQQEEWLLRDAIFKEKIYRPDAYINKAQERALPDDRYRPLQAAMLEFTQGNEEVANFAVGHVENMLWNIASQTVKNPETGETFTSVSEFVNNPQGRLVYQTLTEETAAKVEELQGINGFYVNQGDQEIIGMIAGKANIATPFHEHVHFATNRIIEGSVLEQNLIPAVNKIAGHKGRNVRKSAAEFDVRDNEIVAELAEVYLMSGLTPQGATQGEVDAIHSLAAYIRAMYEFNDHGQVNFPHLGTVKDPAVYIKSLRSATAGKNYDARVVFDAMFFNTPHNNSFTAQTIADEFIRTEDASGGVVAARDFSVDAEFSVGENLRVPTWTVEELLGDVGSEGIEAPIANQQQEQPRVEAPAWEESQLKGQPKVSFPNRATQDFFRLPTLIKEIGSVSRKDRPKTRKETTRLVKAIAEELGLPPMDRTKGMSAKKRQAERNRYVNQMLEESAKYQQQIVDAIAEFEGVPGQLHIDAPLPNPDMDARRKSVGKKFFQTDYVKAMLPETKVVDSRGYPRVMFHGTLAAFKEFSKSFWSSGEGSDMLGKGFYFSESYESANKYAKIKYSTSHISSLYNEDKGRQLRALMASIAAAKRKDNEAFTNKLTEPRAIAKMQKLAQSEEERFDVIMKGLEGPNPKGWFRDAKDFIETYEPTELAKKEYPEILELRSKLDEKISPNVHLVYLDIRNPLDIDSMLVKEVSVEEGRRLAALTKEEIELSNQSETFYKLPVTESRKLYDRLADIRDELLDYTQRDDGSWVSTKEHQANVNKLISKFPELAVHRQELLSVSTGKDLFNTIEQISYARASELALSRPVSEVRDTPNVSDSLTKEYLKAMGYDGLVHIADQGRANYRQWIAWDESQIHHVFKVAPPKGELLAQTSRDDAPVKSLEDLKKLFPGYKQGRGIDPRKGMLADLRAQAAKAFAQPGIRTVLADKLLKAVNENFQLEPVDMVMLHYYYLEQLARLRRLEARGTQYAKREIAKIRTFQSNFIEVKGQVSDTLNAMRAVMIPTAMLELAEEIAKHPQLRNNEMLKQTVMELSLEDMLELNDIPKTAKQLRDYLRDNPELNLNQTQKNVLAALQDPRGKSKEELEHQFHMALLAIDRDELFRDTLTAYFYSNLLLSPEGRKRDFLTNTARYLHELYFRNPTMGALDLVISVVGRKPRTRFVRESFVYYDKNGKRHILNPFSGIDEGFKTFMDVMKRNISIQEVQSKYSMDLRLGANATDIWRMYGDKDWKRRTGSILDFTKRLVVGIDAIQRVVSKEAATKMWNTRLRAMEQNGTLGVGLRAIAEQYIGDKSMSAEKREEKIQALIKDPTEMQATFVTEFGNITTFSERPDFVGQALHSLRRDSDQLWAKFVSLTGIKPLAWLSPATVAVPFLGVMSNVLRAGIRMFPVGIGASLSIGTGIAYAPFALFDAAGLVLGTVSGMDYKSRGLSRREIFMRMASDQLLGYMMFLLFSSWLETDDFVALPLDTNEWEFMKQNGMTPGTFRVPGLVEKGDYNKYIPVPEPFSYALLPMMTGIKAANRAAMTGDPKEAAKQAGKAIFSIRNFVYYNSYFTDALRAISGDSLFDMKKIVSGFLPASALTRQMAAASQSYHSGEAQYQDLDIGYDEGLGQYVARNVQAAVQGAYGQTVSNTLAKYMGEVVPGIEGIIPGQVTAFGEPYGREVNLDLNLFPGEWYPEAVPLNEDPVAMEWYNLEFYPSIGLPDSWTLAGEKVELTTEQKRDFGIEQGRAIYQRIQPLLRHPLYRTAERERRIELQQKLIEKARTEAKNIVVRKYRLDLTAAQQARGRAR